MQNLHIKKIFLYTLIGSIALSALMGIWAILSGEFGEFQGRILGTTLTVVGTSILGLACGAFLESPKSANFALKTVPILGIILAFISALITLSWIWNISSWQAEMTFKILTISSIFAFSLAQLSLLSLANLSQKFQWVLTAVYLAALSLALIISILIVVEPGGESNFILRLIGVLAVVDAALTIMIPIFHRLSRGDFAEKETTVKKIDTEIAKLQKEIEKLEMQKAEILSTAEKTSLIKELDLLQP